MLAPEGNRSTSLFTLVSLHHWCSSRNVQSCPPPTPSTVYLRSTPWGDAAVLASETQAVLFTTEADLHSHQTPPVSVCFPSSRVNTTLVEGLPFSRCFKGMSCTACFPLHRLDSWSVSKKRRSSPVVDIYWEPWMETSWAKHLSRSSVALWVLWGSLNTRTFCTSSVVLQGACSASITSVVLWDDWGSTYSAQVGGSPWVRWLWCQIAPQRFCWWFFEMVELLYEVSIWWCIGSQRGQSLPSYNRLALWAKNWLVRGLWFHSSL